MVKGVSKRIVHVKTPPGEMFDEAIFILKDQVVGVNEEEIIKEAISVAEKSGIKRGKISKKTLSAVLFGVMGGIFVATLWILTAII